MSNKISVGAVITQSYSFAFRNFLNNLGAIWIPILILAVLSEVYFVPMMATAGDFVTVPPGAGQEAQTAAAQANLAIFARMAPAWGLMLISCLFLLPSAVVGITREALGQRRGSAFLQNPLSVAVFRMIGALLLVGLIWVVAVILVAIGFGIIGAAGVMMSGGAGTPGAPVGAGAIVTGLVIGVLGLVVACVFAYGFTRLTFLIAPVVVGEEKIGLRRSWQLGRGNFWRFVGAIIATFIPLLIVSLIIGYLINGADFLAGLDPSLSQAERLAFNKQLMAEATERRQSYWFLMIPFTVLYYTVFLGIMSGLSAFSYRELTEGTAQSAESVF